MTAAMPFYPLSYQEKIEHWFKYGGDLVEHPDKTNNLVEYLPGIFGWAAQQLFAPQVDWASRCKQALDLVSTASCTQENMSHHLSGWLSLDKYVPQPHGTCVAKHVLSWALSLKENLQTNLNNIAACLGAAYPNGLPNDISHKFRDVLFRNITYAPLFAQNSIIGSFDFNIPANELSDGERQALIMIVQSVHPQVLSWRSQEMQNSMRSLFAQSDFEAVQTLPWHHKPDEQFIEEFFPELHKQLSLMLTGFDWSDTELIKHCALLFHPDGPQIKDKLTPYPLETLELF